jgi:hypothetical protein
LRLYAATVRVFDERHLGHQVGNLYKLAFGVASGDYDMQVLTLVAQRVQDLIQRQISKPEDYIQLINKTIWTAGRSLADHYKTETSLRSVCLFSVPRPPPNATSSDTAR